MIWGLRATELLHCWRQLLISSLFFRWSNSAKLFLPHCLTSWERRWKIPFAATRKCQVIKWCWRATLPDQASTIQHCQMWKHQLWPQSLSERKRYSNSSFSNFRKEVCSLKAWGKENYVLLTHLGRFIDWDRERGGRLDGRGRKPQQFRGGSTFYSYFSGIAHSN